MENDTKAHQVKCAKATNEQKAKRALRNATKWYRCLMILREAECKYDLIRDSKMTELADEYAFKTMVFAKKLCRFVNAFRREDSTSQTPKHWSFVFFWLLYNGDGTQRISEEDCEYSSIASPNLSTSNDSLEFWMKHKTYCDLWKKKTTKWKHTILSRETLCYGGSPVVAAAAPSTAHTAPAARTPAPPPAPPRTDCD